MNILTVIFILLMIWCMYRGFKNGFAKEIDGLVSLFMALVILSIAFLLLGGIFQKKTRITIIAGVMLVIASFLYRLLRILMKSVETVSRLPIIHFLDRIAGAAAGAIKTLIVFWILYIIIDNFPIGQFGEWVMGRTEQSAVLMEIYHKNYIAEWIMGIHL